MLAAIAMLGAKTVVRSFFVTLVLLSQDFPLAEGHQEKELKENPTVHFSYYDEDWNPIQATLGPEWCINSTDYMRDCVIDSRQVTCCDDEFVAACNVSDWYHFGGSIVEGDITFQCDANHHDVPRRIVRLLNRLGCIKHKRPYPPPPQDQNQTNTTTPTFNITMSQILDVFRIALDNSWHACRVTRIDNVRVDGVWTSYYAWEWEYSDGDNKHTAAIVGGVVGGVLVCAFLLGVYVICVRRRGQRNQPKIGQPPQVVDSEQALP